MDILQEIGHLGYQLKTQETPILSQIIHSVMAASDSDDKLEYVTYRFDRFALRYGLTPGHGTVRGKIFYIDQSTPDKSHELRQLAEQVEAELKDHVFLLSINLTNYTSEPAEVVDGLE